MQWTWPSLVKKRNRQTSSHVFVIFCSKLIIFWELPWQFSKCLSFIQSSFSAASKPQISRFANLFVICLLFSWQSLTTGFAFSPKKSCSHQYCYCCMWNATNNQCYRNCCFVFKRLKITMKQNFIVSYWNFFFQLALSPSPRIPSEPISVTLDTQFVLKVEGVIEHGQHPGNFFIIINFLLFKFCLILQGHSYFRIVKVDQCDLISFISNGVNFCEAY